MSDAAITIRGLGKRYWLGERERYRALRDSVPRALRASFRRLRSAIDGSPAATDGAETHIWALRDVSLSVREGEVVGIIGRNGAGKSTLLKVLSRITEPTEGRAVVRGRVGSLLEIGTGFHPELTGRENIYLNGAILGMRKREIDARFDEIVAFAEVEAFLDSPVKRYSSGMQMRLAFAVAAHLEPEILLVDEVLAVGDAQFQKKCLGKMGAVATTGRTVLLVSHNMAAIQSLCGRVLWLDQGHVRHEGSAARIVSTYLQKSFSPTSERRWVDSSTAPGNEHVRLRSARVRPAEGSPSAPATTETPLLLEFEYWNLRPGAHLNLSLQVYTEEGVMAFNTAPTPGMGFYPEPLPAGLFRDTCRIPGNFLNDGIHRVELLVVRDDTIVQLRIEDLLVFDVHDAVRMRGSWYDKWQGAVRPKLQWTSERLDSDPVETLAASVPSC